MGLYLVILLIIGVVGRQSQRYYVHVLAAVCAWLVLLPMALWLSSISESANWGFVGFLLMGISYAIPIVIVAIGYERRSLVPLIPRRARASTDK